MQTKEHKGQGEYMKKHNNWDADAFIIMLVLAIVVFVIDAIVSYGVATSDLPFWVKYWLLK